MRKHVRVLLFALFFSPAISFSAGPKLWQEAEYGMSHQDVRSVFDVTAGDEGTLKSGATGDLYIRNYEAGDHPFKVVFFFKNRKLVQVTLKSRQDENPMRYQVQSIKNILTGKYGDPVSYEENSEAFGGYASGTWKQGKTNISLTWMKSNGIFNIVYQTRLAEEGAKF